VETLQHKLQEFNPGIVWLDTKNKIVALNDFAYETLGGYAGELIGQDVLQLHPEKSREKVKFLIEKSTCPADLLPPMSMMINIPERLLLIKVSKMTSKGSHIGTCMIFYDLTELTTLPQKLEPQKKQLGNERRQLLKLPVYKNNQVLLVDLESISAIQADGHYSTLYSEKEKYLCNLSLSDLEGRIGSKYFHRVHRSFIVNLRYAKVFEKVDETFYLIVEHCEGIKIPISKVKVNAIKQALGLSQ